MTAIFHRKKLAEQIAKSILEAGPTTAVRSGLFLAAPRRTGKSTFLREDLRPQLEASGAFVLYVDLWVDRQADPGYLIEAAIRDALISQEGLLLRLARSTGMERLSLGGNSFALDRIGLGKEITLTQALAHISDEVKKPIVLIIDEAQQAATTQKGNDAMFALKAARDELNSSRHSGLYVVATGSNRDKLALLRNSKDQAFFMAAMTTVPMLGRDYVEWFCANVGLQAPLDPGVVDSLFTVAGRRPELLYAAADAVRLDFACEPQNVAVRFEEALREQIVSMEMDALRAVYALSPLQRAVLLVMASKGEAFVPYEMETLEAYGRVLDFLGAPQNADVPNVQTALAALQSAGLVWKEGRGVYALEDASLPVIMEEHGLLKFQDEGRHGEGDQRHRS